MGLSIPAALITWPSYKHPCASLLNNVDVALEKYKCLITGTNTGNNVMI